MCKPGAHGAQSLPDKQELHNWANMEPGLERVCTVRTREAFHLPGLPQIFAGIQLKLSNPLPQFEGKNGVSFQTPGPAGDPHGEVRCSEGLRFEVRP